MSTRWRSLLAILVSGLLLSALVRASQPDDALVVTAGGLVQGFIKDGVTQFRGIPYAAAPVGELRWRPPQPPSPWQGVRDGTQFGNICLQVTTYGAFGGPANDNEDCLYLNIYTPHLPRGSHGLLPVIVFIHGGGNIDGGSNDYDGSKLAAQGPSVVVTINYRLGLLGFMSHPAIDAEGHPFSNYGILDQQAALKWVQKNIGSFGGDKNNVTLAGQSAGSIDTEANVISPLAAGFFHRAILESVVIEPVPLATAEANGMAFAEAAGCGSGTDAATAACLRGLSAQQIFALSGTEGLEAPYETEIAIDGTILPDAFTMLIQEGRFNHVPIMSGWTEDEANFTLGIIEYFSGVPASTADYAAMIAAFGASPPYPPGTAALAQALYPLSKYPTPQLALDALGTDLTACTQRHTNLLLATQVPLYEYEFDDRTAPWYYPALPGFLPLAYHTSDIQYLFPGWHGGPEGVPHALNAGQEFLSDELVEAWTRFARTGNPNGHGNDPWPRLDSRAGHPAALSESLPKLYPLTDAEIVHRHQCDFWDSISIY